MIKLEGLSKEAVLDEAKINNGVWIHLESASLSEVTGLPTPLYLGGDETKPQRALVRSNRCKAIKEAEAGRQKTGFARVRVAKKKDRDTVIADTAIMPEDERFSYLLVALQNFSADAPMQQVEPADAKAIFAMSSMDNIVQQIREAAFTDENYLAGPETEAGNGSPPAPKPAEPKKSPEANAD